MNLNIIYARWMCLAGKDVVYPFSVITAVDTAERMRYPTLTCAEERVRESELAI